MIARFPVKKPHSTFEQAGLPAEDPALNDLTKPRPRMGRSSRSQVLV